MVKVVYHSVICNWINYHNHKLLDWIDTCMHEIAPIYFYANNTIRNWQKREVNESERIFFCITRDIEKGRRTFAHYGSLKKLLNLMYAYGSHDSCNGLPQIPQTLLFLFFIRSVFFVLPKNFTFELASHADPTQLLYYVSFSRSELCARWI